MTEQLQPRERTNPLGVLGAKARPPSGAQHLLGLAAILCLASAGCSEQPSRPPTTQFALVEPAHAHRIPVADRPPASLVQPGQSATSLFDAAWSSDWRRSDADVQSLNEAVTDSTRATSDLVTAWNRIQPAIERRGHVDDARRFSDIVVELMGAKRPADFVAPVHAELAAAARLESIFTTPQ